MCNNCRQYIFAWMMAQFTNEYNQLLEQRKRSLFAHLQGNILEIGPGTGANFPYFPEGIHWVGIEPNPYMHPFLNQSAAATGLQHINLYLGTSESMDIEDNSMDFVISTLVLCSVPNLSATLEEILRVLKPGGTFLFLEHVAAPQGSLLRKIQRVIRPLWKAVADGCNPDRETWLALENAGFARVNYQHFRIRYPIVSPHIIGMATKKDNL
ncbi:MAG: class I SAM-dependent methyltransferase [Calothrix sp. MO_167.B12]|nr:class I SAM-dependent methyltransferase [Calothrix sp. MO_167.B12]